ncbi:GNAT family N-acetyltransferase [Actinoplanes sp. NPDC049548]|uniref:GNAT family N-acetyltransferase n=1 Tax=Actinoplanes sp. NPDC049548 TaxID=3155152 RepID=UPI003429DB98
MACYQRMTFHLDTERLIMRPWDVNDAESLRALHAERGDGTPSIEDARRLIADMLAGTERTGIALLPVRCRGSEELIGYCGLIVGRSGIDEPEIAYELFGRAHGRGYATEAARAVVDAAAATGRTRLWSTVRAWNAPSFRVLEKLGFQRDHVTTDDRGELVWLTRTLP